MTLELLEIGGTISAGKLVLHGRTVVAQQLKQFADGDVTVRISAGKRTRSSQQNRYWHKVVVGLFAEHTGYGLVEMKDALALELLPTEVVDLTTGEIRIVPGHTSHLTVEQFNDLILRAQELGARLGVYIPDPNEVAA